MFDLSTAELVVFVFGVTLGATALGAFLGSRVRHLSDSLSEPFGVLQGALLGVVGLILAFGLSLALSRYEDRREVIVTEANTIGTTYLRAQTLPEPIRTRSLGLLVTYTESAIKLSDYVPGTGEEDQVTAAEQRLQRRLWRLAGAALEREPVASAPRLYTETLNQMIDAQNSRTAALNNQVPTTVLMLEILGAAIALGLLAAFLAVVGRGLPGVLLASALVAFLLFITADLDRPTRGAIKVPDTVLTDELESMRLPPAAAPVSAPARGVRQEP
ncbi:hypothetical protein BH20ACT15_BH20ACT15_16390 [soil metagenome]